MTGRPRTVWTGMAGGAGGSMVGSACCSPPKASLLKAPGRGVRPVLAVGVDAAAC